MTLREVHQQVFWKKRNDFVEPKISERDKKEKAKHTSVVNFGW